MCSAYCFEVEWMGKGSRFDGLWLVYEVPGSPLSPAVWVITNLRSFQCRRAGMTILRGRSLPTSYWSGASGASAFPNFPLSRRVWERAGNNLNSINSFFSFKNCPRHSLSFRYIEEFWLVGGALPAVVLWYTRSRK